MTKTESPASDTRPASLADRNDDTRSLTTYLPSEGAPHDVEKAPSSDSSVTQEPQSQDGTPNVECKGPDASDVVDWDSADDPHNPITGPVLENGASLLWSPQSPSSRRLGPLPPKRHSFASTVFAPGVPLLTEEFHSTNEALASFTVSVYIIGFCLGLLVLAPMSELCGRSPIMHASNIFFIIFSIACAVSTNMAMFIVFRLFMGIAGCPPLTLGGGTIADLMPPAKRGRALSIWTMGPLMGPVVAPVVGGFMAGAIGWEWCFWLTAILTGTLTILSFLLLHETYAPVLLKRKAERLRRKMGNQNLKSKFDKGQTPRQLFVLAIVRPTKMLIFSPIVFILALEMSIIYSYLYFLFTTFTVVFGGEYEFTAGEVGLSYLGLGIGFAIGQFLVGSFSDAYMKKKSAEGPMKPEYRLPPLIPAGFLIPIGLFWYGWTAEYHVHWIVPIIGTSFIGIGTLFAFLPIQMYLIDAFTIYAASAIATNTVVRSLFGAVLPLASQPLYDRLGLGWGNSVLAFTALALSPVPFVLIKYGERIRTSPRFELKNL